MIIFGFMDARRREGLGATVLYVALVCALVIGSSDANRRALRSIVKNDEVDGLWNGEIDEHLAERIWSNCRGEVMLMKDYVPDLNFFLVWEASGEANSETALLKKRYWHVVVNSVSPEVKQALLVCAFNAQRLHMVKRPNAMLQPRSLFSDLSPVPPLSRSPIGAPAPSPALVPSSSPSLSPSSSFSPPAETPKESPPPPLIKSAPPPVVESISRGPPLKPNFVSPSATDDVEARKKKVLIALIALMSVMTIILAALLLYLLKNRKNRHGPKYPLKDDKPLLNLSSGSSPDSQGFENPSKSKKLHIKSGKMQSSASIASIAASGTTDMKSSSTVAVKIDEKAPLPPPPGKSFTPTPSPPPPPAPAPPPPPVPAPRPPPAPKGARPPPPSGKFKTTPPKGTPGALNVASDGDNLKGELETPKPKLKPFFWDKVQAADDPSMVWHELKAGSFQVNEEMMESLFGYAPMDKNNVERKKESPSLDNVAQYIKIIDPRKAQNLSILLRALNVTTEEVCDALLEGNDLPAELIQTLIKMAPSADEELKLRLYNGEVSHLGPAERFLKRVVEIPHAFRRLESLLLMSTYQEEVNNIKESHETLEVACDKLKNSRLFLKLLEAVLKTGNRMNDGTYRGGAQAFKLDTLLKLSDVKGTDGKTTLLHFVVQEMIRSEGIRAARTASENKGGQSEGPSDLKVDELGSEDSEKTEEYYKNLGLQVVSGLSTELENVKKASVIDADGLTSSVSKLGHALLKTRDFLNTDMKNLEEDSEFHKKLASFVEQAEADIPHHIEKEKKIMDLIKSTADYFHGNAGREEGLRLFVTVREFLIILDKVCKGLEQSLTKAHPPIKQDSTVSECSTESHQPRKQISDVQQKLFPAIQERRMDDSSSDEESS